MGWIAVSSVMGSLSCGTSPNSSGVQLTSTRAFTRVARMASNRLMVPMALVCMYAAGISHDGVTQERAPR